MQNWFAGLLHNVCNWLHKKECLSAGTDVLFDATRANDSTAEEIDPFSTELNLAVRPTVQLFPALTTPGQFCVRMSKRWKRPCKVPFDHLPTSSFLRRTMHAKANTRRGTPLFSHLRKQTYIGRIFPCHPPLFSF